jgi:hypothetical protein
MSNETPVTLEQCIAWLCQALQKLPPMDRHYNLGETAPIINAILSHLRASAAKGAREAATPPNFFAALPKISYERLMSLRARYYHHSHGESRDENDNVAEELADVANALGELQSLRASAAKGDVGQADNFNQEFFALRAALRDWPKLPPAYVLKWLDGNFAVDWQRGKEMQRELGLAVIPPKTECEEGAGMWDRITKGAWRPDCAPSPEQLREATDATQALPSPEMLERVKP